MRTLLPTLLLAGVLGAACATIAADAGKASQVFYTAGEAACLVQKAVPVNVDRAIVFLLGIVEDDHFQRNIRLRHEAVTGKAILGVGHAETVAGRTRRRFKKFLHPLGSQKGAAIRVGRNLGRGAEISDRAREFDVAVGSRSVKYAHIVVTAVYFSEVRKNVSGSEDLAREVGLPKILAQAVVHRD